MARPRRGEEPARYRLCHAVMRLFRAAPRRYFRMTSPGAASAGWRGGGVPGSACPQRAEPPGWSVTSATIPSGIPPSLWTPPHSRARPCTTVWLGGRVDPWRTHGGLVAWLIGRGTCGTHGRIDRAAVLRMACVRGRLFGGSDRCLPHWAAGLLGRGDVRMRGCPSVAALAGPSSAAGVATPVAGYVGRGSGLCCGLADLGRARARRLDWWLRPAADLAVG